MPASPASARRAVLQLPPEPVSKTRDLTVDGSAGPVPLRLYRPAAEDEASTLPCLAFIHGGGWVFGDLDSYDALCCRLSNQAGCCVVSIHYRLAPEHSFPAAIEDCVAGYTAILRDAQALRIDPARIAVAGDSAGGAIAAVLSHMGRDGDIRAPVHQTLIYPVVDLDQGLEDYGPDLPGMTITGSTMVYFRDHYTPRRTDRTDWRASPIWAAPHGLPPTLIITCGQDPLAAEGRRYADRLAEASVRVAHLHLSDQTHGMITMTKVNRSAMGLQDFIASALREAFNDFDQPLGANRE
jgi:acetyl esterase